MSDENTQKSILERRIDALKCAPPSVQLETLNRLQNAGLIKTFIRKDDTVMVLIRSARGCKMKTLKIGIQGFCGKDLPNE